MKLLQSQIASQTFSPWDYENQNNPYKQSFAKRNFKQLNWQQQKKKNRIKQTIEQFNNDKLPYLHKTLIGIDQKGKNKKVQQLKQLIKKKKDNQKDNKEHQQLPPIRLSTLKYRNSNPQIIPLNYEKYKQEEENQIFKKYGEHRKYNQSKVQRSFSHNQTIEYQQQKRFNIKKYETLDLNYYTQQIENKIIKLNGKSFKPDVRASRQNKNHSITYLPSKPNITPHHILFGHDSQQILKKVLKQISFKIN